MDRTQRGCQEVGRTKRVDNGAASRRQQWGDRRQQWGDRNIRAKEVRMLGRQDGED